MRCGARTPTSISIAAWPTACRKSVPRSAIAATIRDSCRRFRSAASSSLRRWSRCILRRRLRRRRPSAYARKIGLAAAGFALFAIAAFTRVFVWGSRGEAPIVIAVSVFDNETGNSAYDRAVAGLSDLVVDHLTKIDPDRVAVIGNAAILRQPRNIRNLKAVADTVKADYVLLGQLQTGETGLRFITHFIRLQDHAHLKANRLPVTDPTLAGLESAVIDEFDRAVREHVLKHPAN